MFWEVSSYFGKQEDTVLLCKIKYLVQFNREEEANRRERRDNTDKESGDKDKYSVGLRESSKHRYKSFINKYI